MGRHPSSSTNPHLRPRRFARWLGPWLLALGLGLATPGGAADLRLLTETNPPFNMIDPATRHIAGMSTDLVNRIFDLAGVGRVVELSSWRNAFETARTSPDTCVYSTTMTEDRKPHFSWVGPLYSNALVLVAKTSAPVPRTLDDLKGRTIGVYFGDVTTDLMAGRGLILDQTSDGDLSNYRKLLAGRIQYWAVGRPRFHQLGKTQDIEGLREVFKLADTDLYLACNPAVPREVVEALQASLDRLRADGVPDQIQRRY